MKSPKNVEKFPLVQVTWLDASIRIDAECATDQPESIQKFGAPFTNQDVGYLVRRNKDVIVLASSRTPEGNTYQHATTIFTGWVQKIEYMQPTVAEELTRKPRRKATKGPADGTNEPQKED